mgnify:CR=1 FL=1
MTSRDRTPGGRPARRPSLQEVRPGIVAEARSFGPALLIAFLVLIVVSASVGRVYVVPSGSMEPTLHGCTGCNNDRIVVEKVSYYFNDPQPGDVIVFEGPDSWNTDFHSERSSNVVLRGFQNLMAAVGMLPNSENILTKRVIATEGQTVSCQAGDPGIMVDGAVIESDFTLSPVANPVSPETGSEACGGDYFGPVTVPEHSLWVMGDNRTNSADSRYHMGDVLQGTVPVDNVRGKVRFIILPFNRIGGVDNVDLNEDPAA